MDFFTSNTIPIRHRPLKRLFDILFSLFILTLGFPIFCLIAVLIYITSKGNPIYAQKRIGRAGKEFWCYKFRTMHLGSEKRLKELLESSEDLKKEWETSFKLKNDPRVTSIGACLRKTSLDEFPQFWNVLKGDLSIVGPRPVVEQEINQYYKEKATKILSVRPGVTGLWQISGRNDVEDYQKRILLDEFYIDKQSFWFDLKLIAKTIPAVFFSKGAY